MIVCCSLLCLCHIVNYFWFVFVNHSSLQNIIVALYALNIIVKENMKTLSLKLNSLLSTCGVC